MLGEQLDLNRVYGYRHLLLDHGFANRITFWGDDLLVAQVARESTHRDVPTLTAKDADMLRSWAANRHNVFRCCGMVFRLKAPMDVRNQIWRTFIASCHAEDQDGWVELSRRYVKKDLEFYNPYPHGSEEWGEQNQLYNYLVAEYQRRLDRGERPEQARKVLPGYAIYTQWTWCISLEAICRFLGQRKALHAQPETRLYAEALELQVTQIFPISGAALIERFVEEYK